jgi:hypothetical protein
MLMQVLVEGGSDVTVVREILQRRFNLVENIHFQIHPHRGKGKFPENILAKPDPRNRGPARSVTCQAARLRPASWLLLRCGSELMQMVTSSPAPKEAGLLVAD